MAEESKTKVYPYVVLTPLENGIDFRLAGQFDGRSPEQAVEAYLAAFDPAQPPLKGGVIAVPASKWYVVEWEGTPRVDFEFKRPDPEEAPAEAGETPEPAPAEPAPAEPAAVPPEALAPQTIGAGGPADPSAKQL